MLTIPAQVIHLFLLAIPVACIAWTVTHEEVTKEPREFCVRKSKDAKSLLIRKLFYLFTCEYCFSHYVTLFFIIVTGFQMLYESWVGYLISFFSVVWIANVYMSIFGRIRIDLKSEKIEAKIKEVELDECVENKKAET